MRALHDPACKAEILRRIGELRADSPRRWGTMSADQMLWHVNEAMAGVVGRVAREPAKPMLPRPLLKFLVLNVPWMKGAPTVPQWVARDRHDFAAERARCRALIDELTSRPVDGPWPIDPMLGRMSGLDVMRLHAKHLDHHLKQFGL